MLGPPGYDEIELNLQIPNPAYVRKIEEKANFSDVYIKEMDHLREKLNQMTRIMKKARRRNIEDHKFKSKKRLNSTQNDSIRRNNNELSGTGCSDKLFVYFKLYPSKIHLSYFPWLFHNLVSLILINFTN